MNTAPKDSTIPNKRPAKTAPKIFPRPPMITTVKDLENRFKPMVGNTWKTGAIKVPAAAARAQPKAKVIAVSYTHLDVYKRQVHYWF